MVLPMLSLFYVSAYINCNTFVNLIFLTVKKAVEKAKKAFSQPQTSKIETFIESTNQAAMRTTRRPYQSFVG